MFFDRTVKKYWYNNALYTDFYAMRRQSEPEQATDTRTDTTVRYKNFTRLFAKVHSNVILFTGKTLTNSKQTMG